MNFTQMLFTPVKSLDEYTPACEQRQEERAKKHIPNHLKCVAANKATHETAVAKYRAVMGDEWVRTSVIEARLGMSRSSCMPNLLKWQKMGLVRKRKVGDPKNWNRAKGNEWRFVK